MCSGGRSLSVTSLNHTSSASVRATRGQAEMYVVSRGAGSDAQVVIDATKAAKLVLMQGAQSFSLIHQQQMFALQQASKDLFRLQHGTGDAYLSETLVVGTAHNSQSPRSLWISSQDSGASLRVIANNVTDAAMLLSSKYGTSLVLSNGFDHFSLADTGDGQLVLTDKLHQLMAFDLNDSSTTLRGNLTIHQTGGHAAMLVSAQGTASAAVRSTADSAQIDIDAANGVAEAKVISCAGCGVHLQLESSHSSFELAVDGVTD